MSFPHATLAQSGRGERPKIGLVLSGGSARGLAHVGVLKVLEEERIPIDVVTGTSMGSIIGGLYAMGYSPSMIEQIALTQDWDGLFSDKAPRRSEVLEQRLAGRGVFISLPFKGRELRLPSGVLSGQQAMTTLSRLSWGLHHVDDLTTLHLPFTAVATRLRTGEAVALSNVPIAAAIRASMSLPSVFVPSMIDGDLYIDGGLSRNVPAEDALSLGADWLIGVDVGAALDSASAVNLSFVDVLVEAAFFQSVRYDEAQRERIDILIQPDVEGLTRTDFNHAKEWIRRGETAARAMIPRLRALADSLDLPPAVFAYPFPHYPEPAFITEITVRGGVPDHSIRLVYDRLRLEENMWLGPDEIESAIGRVYGTGLFDLVTYRVIPAGSGSSALDISVVPRDAPNRIGIGFRHDSRYNTALLLDATFWSAGVATTTTSLRARLGEQLQFVASHSARSGSRSRFTLGGKVGFASAPVDMYLPDKYAEVLGADQQVPIFSMELSTIGADFFVGFASMESLRAGLLARMAHIFVEERVAGRVTTPDSLLAGAPVPIITDTDQDMLAAGVFLQFDTFDAVDFPTRGLRVSATSELGASNALPQVAVPPVLSRGPLNLGPYLFTAIRSAWYVPFSSRVSLFGGVAATYGSGESLPTHYYGFLGGRETVTVLTNAYIPLYGLRSQERFGRKAYMGMLGIQWEFRTDLFVKMFANGGDTFDLFSDDDRKQLGEELYRLVTDKPVMGYGIEVGLRTRAGPLQLIVAIADRDEPIDLGIRFGFDF